MKIRRVRANNRTKAFEVATSGKTLVYPFAKLDRGPSPVDPLVELYVDPEIGNEGFTFTLQSGYEDTVHIDHVLDYNRDPGYLKDLALYQLTVEAQERLRETALSKREIIRRLGTSATQFYRLLDQTNYRKSIGQLLELLYILDCDVEFVVKARRSA